MSDPSCNLILPIFVIFGIVFKQSPSLHQQPGAEESQDRMAQLLTARMAYETQKLISTGQSSKILRCYVFFEVFHDMKGILLAAGRGVRLSPLTDHTPKPLLPVGGKPILQRIIEGLEINEVRDLAIIVGHLADQIIEYFGDGARFNVNIHYFHQKIVDGTARAVLPAADFIQNEPFFLGYGDVLVDRQDYQAFFQAYQNALSDSLLAAWASDTPWIGGVLVIQNERLVDLVEKPAKGTEPGNLINAGLMVLQPEIFDHIRQVKPSPRGEYELTDALLSLARRSTVRIHQLKTFWSDIGTFDKLRQADRYFQHKKQ